MNSAASKPPSPPWIFLGACVVVALLGQGARSLWETDEGRYAEPARLMIETGNWLVPTLQGRPHLTKPPGTYWAVAAGILAFGKSAFGARFLLGLAHVLSAICVRSIARVLHTTPGQSVHEDSLAAATASRAGWIWLAMFYPFAAGSILTTDAFHVACALAAIACACRGSESRAPGKWLLLSGAMLGAASLFKGPLAWLPYIGFVLGWVFCLRRMRPGARVVSATGVSLAVVIGLGWYVWAVWIGDVPGARESFLQRETVDRLTTSGDHEPHWFGWFIPILLLGVMPWWGSVFRGLRGAFSDAAGRLLVVWAAVPFVIHSAAPAKNWLYVVSVCAPLAIVAARGSTKQRSLYPMRPLLLTAWLVFLVVARFAVSFVPTTKDMAKLAAAVEKADPTGQIPVAFVSGRDLRGLYFYRGGNVIHLESRNVQTDWSDGDLLPFAAERAEKSEPWVLVSEWGKHATMDSARATGDAAKEIAEVGGLRIAWDGMVPRLEPVEGWHVYLVTPRPGSKEK